MTKKFRPGKEWVKWRESLVEGKNPCYSCRKKGKDRSGDNFHFYSEERGGSCFSCGYKLLSEEVLDEIGATEEGDIEEYLKEMSRKNKKFSLEGWRKSQEYLTYKGRGYRGISDSVNKAYGVRYEYDPEDGSLVAQHIPVTTNLVMTGIKTRYMPKDFDARGEVSGTADLIGQYRHRNASGKFIVITAGEVDMLSAATILEKMNTNKKYDSIPVVSPTTGEGSAFKQIQAQYEFLSRFERIVICFDNDNAGQEALAKIASVLPREKMWVMRLDKKDTNAYIFDKSSNKAVDNSQEWINAFWKAEKYAPPGAIGSYSLMDKIKKKALQVKVTLPMFMSDLEDLMAGGLPMGEYGILFAASGIGKTTYVNACILHWIFNTPYKVSILSLEADGGGFGMNLLSSYMKVSIDLMRTPEEKLEFLNSEEAEKAAETLFTIDGKDSRFHLIENAYIDIEDLKDRIEMHVIKLGAKIIILDVLTNITQRMGLSEQADFAAWLDDLTTQYQIAVLGTGQIRKNDTGSRANSTGADLFEEDIKGAGALLQHSAYNIALIRNKESDCEIERMTTYCKLMKNRHGRRTSPLAGQYLYDIETGEIRDRTKIVGMPLGIMPRPNRDGEVVDDRMIVGPDLLPVPRNSGPQRG